MSFIINAAAGLQLKSILIQEDVPALVSYRRLSEMFNNKTFKKYCCKKISIIIRNVGQTSLGNLIPQLFIYRRENFCILAQVSVTMGYIYSYQSKKKSLKGVNNNLILGFGDC